MSNIVEKKSSGSPSRSKVELCKQLGLEISNEMNQDDVLKLISEALKQPRYKEIYEEIQRQKFAEIEKEEREIYGDVIYDELKKWEKLCDPYKQYILVFKRGSTIHADIVEFETADIIGENKYSILLGILLPKVHKDRDGDYIEWEKAVNLKLDQIIKLEKLIESIDLFDIEKFNEIKTKCNLLVSEFNS